MQLTNETLLKIELATRKNFPNEMCGIIRQDGNFLELTNISEKPTVSFKIDSLTYVNLEKDVAFIIHSHTQDTVLHPITPSLADLELAEALQKPLLICAIKHGQYYQPMQVPPEPNSNYIGRQYIFGVQDCAILARDYFHCELGIELKVNTLLQLYTKKHWKKATDTVIADNDLINMINSAGDRLADTINVLDLQNVTKALDLRKGDILITSTHGMFKNHAMIWTGEAVLNQGDVSKLEALDLHISKISDVYRHPLLMV